MWYDSLTMPKAYAAATQGLRSGDLVEFEVLDEDGARRGYVIAEVIGVRLSASASLPLLLITPLASDHAVVRDWMRVNLSAPHALHICAGPARLCDTGIEEFHIQKVERFRVRSLSSITEEWAVSVHERAPPAAPLSASRAAMAPVAQAIGDVAALVPHGACAGAVPRSDPVMDEVARLSMDLGPSLRPPGTDYVEPLLPTPSSPIRTPTPAPRPTPVLAATAVLAPRDLRGGLPRPEALGLPSLGPPAAIGDVVFPHAAPLWAEPLARGFVQHAHEVKAHREPAVLSVRERLALRAGRPHVLRSAKRLTALHGAADACPAPESDVDEFRAARRASKKERKRGRRRRKGGKKKERRARSTSSSSRSSSSRSNSTEGSAEQLFREASATAASSTKRAQRDALRMPHTVLVESLADISKVLPADRAGARLDRVAIYRQLPAIYVAYFMLVLGPVLRTASGSARNEREARTLCEALDLLIEGKVLPAIMILLSRLKAIEEASNPESGGWAIAQHHELVGQNTGLVSARDREHAARDQRDVLRTRGQIQRAAPGSDRAAQPAADGRGRRGRRAAS